MEPTLKTNSLVIGFRLYNELSNGDIIIFEYGNSYLVKRIVASENDLIEHQGEILSVPENHYYVVGDNTSSSYDSRFWEKPFIPSNRIVAKVIIPFN